jgi:2'-5' RNA ligase
MSKELNLNALYRACRMAFQGASFTEIGTEFEAHLETIRNWARREEWQTFTEELIAAAKARELEAFSAEVSPK